jgi:hypothetical protein
VTNWGSMTNPILALREHLIGEQVSCVVMEATGDYWKPFCYLLEDAGFELMLVTGLGACFWDGDIEAAFRHHLRRAGSPWRNCGLTRRECGCR